MLPAALLTDNEYSTESLGKVVGISSSQERTAKKSPIRQDSLPQQHISISGSVGVERGIEVFGIQQLGKSQVNSIHSGILEISPSQVGSSQISPTHISPLEINPSQISFSQIGISQVGSSKIDLSQAGLVTKKTDQTSFSEIDFAQTNVKPTEIESHQIGSTEIVPSIEDKLVDITSTPSGTIVGTSISPFTHFSNYSQLSSNIQFSATHIWSDLLQSDTQLDIDFQITDLPTGQLAEATITNFDDSGVPNAGTILIDHDANGVGWFIDSTPLDNSEFSGSRGETYLLAATESEASGKYDLLTTVLHELAHLYGFIDGYQGFDANIEMEDGTTKFIGDDLTG